MPLNPASYQKFVATLNIIQNVCILYKTMMAGLSYPGAESVAPDAGGVVRVPSTASTQRRGATQEFDRWMGRPTCLR
jgi:hypothetical protein